MKSISVERKFEPEVRSTAVMDGTYLGQVNLTERRKKGFLDFNWTRKKTQVT